MTDDKIKTEPLTAMNWAKGLGSGLLAGAAFVAVAMLFEKEIIKVGASRLKTLITKP